MSAANATTSSSAGKPGGEPHAAPDAHDTGDHLDGAAEDVISHIGRTSTGGRSDRVDHFDDGAEDTTRVG